MADTPVPRTPSGIAIPILSAGIGTSALALYLVWLANRASSEFEVMGFYLWGIAPVGAILVGIGAGLGYALMARFMDRPVSGALLVCIALLQIAAYFAAQYIEFQEMMKTFEGGDRVSFLAWFDFVTRHMTMTSRHGSPQPLGVWGYLYRVLEIVGFCLGGLIGPLVLRAQPYCRDCGAYLESRGGCLLPAGIEPRPISKKDKAALEAAEAEAAAAQAQALKIVHDLAQMAAEGRTEDIVGVMSEHAPHRRDYERLSHRVHLDLHACRHCGNGVLAAKMAAGKGEKTAFTPIGSFPLVAATQPEPDTPSEPAG